MTIGVFILMSLFCPFWFDRKIYYSSVGHTQLSRCIGCCLCRKNPKFSRSKASDTHYRLFDSMWVHTPWNPSSICGSIFFIILLSRKRLRNPTFKRSYQQKLSSPCSGYCPFHSKHDHPGIFCSHWSNYWLP